MSAHRTGTAVLAGVVATLIYFGTAEFIARAMGEASAPALILGQALIPLLPTVLIKSAIALFGTQDKLALIITIIAGGAGLGALIGWIGARRRGLALVLLIGVGLLPAVLTLTTGSAVTSTLPSLGGVAAGTAVFLILLRIADATTSTAIDAGLPDDGPSAGGLGEPAPPDRRAFFGLAAGLSVVGIAAVAAGQSAAALARSAAGTVTKLVLPRPAASVPAIPAGAELAVAGLTPLVTANEDFYRIDTALIPPSIDSETWQLRIHGRVEQEVTITMAELLDLPLEEHYVSLACVSNEVGGDLVGNAKWLGYPIRELLARAQPKNGADMVLSGSDDGFTASTPLEVLTGRHCWPWG